MIGPWDVPNGHGYEGPDENGYHNYRSGYNMVNSELGHLYYVSLGNKGKRDTDGSFPTDYGLLNTGPFNNLYVYFYATGTVYSPTPTWVWVCSLNIGSQGPTDMYDGPMVMAVHDGRIISIYEILNLFDQSVADGSLTGVGQNPWVAKLRLYFMREMLVIAKEFLEKEKTEWACFTLNRALLRCDGENRPPDFVTGSAICELNDMISDLMAELGCE